jgi:hypothetical protein
MKTIVFLIGFVAGALLVGDESPVKAAFQDGVDLMITAMETEAQYTIEDTDR